MAKKEDVVQVEGIVEEILPGSECLVAIGDGDNKRVVRAYLSGKMRKNYIKIIKGDRVKVELSMYDLTKGRIVYRETNQERRQREEAERLGTVEKTATPEADVDAPAPESTPEMKE